MSDMVVEAVWEEDLRFEATGRGGTPVVLDGDGETGPSPMEALLMALGSCMGIDVVDILNKMRVPFDGLTVRLEGDRPTEPPRRFTAIRLVYNVTGVSADAQPRLERAVALSREKYCSVLHTLQSDVDLSIRIVAA